MNKYKVCVYAIAKNEEMFVERWYESMREADEIYVLDTGSSDNTVKKLRKKGIKVTKKKIDPWRFDKARNMSLKMIPMDADICVCTDLDEVFNKGWRNSLEKIWQKSTNRVHYIYNWSLDKNNTPLVSFYYDKIHSRQEYEWINPVHEILKCNLKKEKIITSNQIILNHYPDYTKPRSSYLPLLELSVQENPDNDRNMHYLGREYMYYKMWNKAIDTLIKHLQLPSSVWQDERSASMRFIARCYIELNRLEEAEMWYRKAINEAIHLRDPLIELAVLKLQQKDWKEVYALCNNALKITNHEKTYVNEPYSWNETPYDLLSIASYNLNNLPEALDYINEAISINPDNQRLFKNKNIIIKQINSL